MKDAVKPNLMQTLEVSTEDLLLGSEKALGATGLVHSSQSDLGVYCGFLLRAREQGLPSRSATGMWDDPEEMH